MRKIKSLLIVFFGLISLNSCSNDDDSNPCPQTEIASMQINDDLKQFDINGWGIDIDNDGTGHTLSLWLLTGTFQPQDTYGILIKLPFKQTGNNIIEEFNYLRVQNGASSEVDFVEGEFESKVITNTNSCFKASFSGRAIVDGNEIIITEGIVEHIYDEPFD